ncbi:MAG: PorP/SprF family type IX secretion system membrane protein, partial [Bacteroidota bacterium]
MNRVLLLSLLLLPIVSFAQDVHFSHIHASPTLINPGMTGLFNGDIRLIGNFRSQWTNVTKGYKTMAGAVDMKIGETRGDNVFGGGLMLISDKAGDLEFRTNTINLTFSILKALNSQGTHFVSLGIQNSFTSNSVNYANIVARDMEPAIMDGAMNKMNYWDLSAGVGWFYSFDRDNSIYLGGSYFHINEPSASIFKDPNVDA